MVLKVWLSLLWSVLRLHLQKLLTMSTPGCPGSKLWGTAMTMGGTIRRNSATSLALILSSTGRYITRLLLRLNMNKMCCSKVAKLEGEKASQAGNYLPIQAKLFIQGWHSEIMREITMLQVGDTRFPLPDNTLLAGKRVKSVVLVLPDNYKLWTIIFKLEIFSYFLHHNFIANC